MSLSRKSAWYGAVLLLLALAVALLVCGGSATKPGKDHPNGAPGDPNASGAADGTHGTVAGAVKTRSAVRPAPGPKPTHGPQQLRDFFLPPQDFEGMGLRDALEDLRAAYVQACHVSGETPLALVFTLPAGCNPVMHLKSGYRTLESNVQLLAAAARLAVTRRGSEFRFSLPKEGDGRTLTGDFTESPATGVTQSLEEAGVTLDPGTRFMPSGSGFNGCSAVRRVSESPENPIFYASDGGLAVFS